jgi:hypothetical protein
LDTESPKLRTGLTGLVAGPIREAVIGISKSGLVSRTAAKKFLSEDCKHLFSS